MPRSAAGFTLVEVLVALTLLGGAVASLAHLWAAATVSNRMARRSSLASLLAAQKIEALRALEWSADADGVETMDTTSDTASLVEPSAGGTGLSQSPADSLERDVPGYVDYADRFGRVLGSPGGAGPPEGTEFVRRWAIHPAVVHEQTVILFQVFVTSSPGRTRAGLDRWRRLQDEAWLVAAKARRTP